MSGDSSLGIGIGLALKSYGRAFRGLLNQYPGAAAAYSLRKLSGAVSNVVRVRRSSDDAEQDFTAAEVDNGTLVAWVNTDVVTISSDFSSGTDSFLAASNCLVTGNVDGILGEDDVLQATATSSGGKRWTRNNTLSVGGSFVVTFKAYAPPTNPAVTHIVEASGAATGSTLVNISSGWTDVEWLFDDFAGNFNNRFLMAMADAGGEYSPASTTDVVYIKDVVVTQTKANGFVATWYDQSGNGNDAVQATTTAQPKIVASGALVLDADGSPAIEFDGVNDSLNCGARVVELSQNAATAVAVSDLNNQASQSAGYIASEGDVVSPYSSNFILGGPAGDAVVWVNATKFGATPTGNQLLGFAWNGTDSFQAYLDGSTSGASGNATVNTETTNTVLGAAGDGTSGLSGRKLTEFISWKSDQTANLPSIFANINAHYNIYP